MRVARARSAARAAAIAAIGFAVRPHRRVIYETRIRRDFGRVPSPRSGSPRLTIAHAAHFGGNWGDRALNYALEVLIGQFAPIAFRRIEAFRSVGRTTMEVLESADLVVVGGGGLFIPDSVPNEISGWAWRVRAAELIGTGTPVVIFGVGFNYFPGQEVTPLFQRELTELVRGTAFFGVRNRGSQHRIRGIVSAVDPDISGRVHVQPCPTTLLSRLPGAPPTKPGGGVGFNLPLDRADRRYDGNSDEIRGAVTEAARRLTATGARIAVMVHVASDLELAKDFSAAGVPHRVVHLNRMPMSAALREYAGLDVMVGGRGHAQLVPFGLGVPIISLGSHPKVRYFLEDIDATDWLVELQGPSEGIADRITGAVRQALDGREERRERMAAAQERLYAQSVANVHTVLAGLSRPS